MNFTIEELILLNRYVQSIVTREEVYSWFDSLEESNQEYTVNGIWGLTVQAQIFENDIDSATKAAGLKATHTPVVMLSKRNEPFRNRGYSLSALKGTVLTQAFRLVLECFALAERRRKSREDSSLCQHWWHKDLSDGLIIKEILSKYSDCNL